MAEGAANWITTMGNARDEALIRSAFARVGEHDADRLNAVAGAVTRVQGFTLLSTRYAIAVLALEALDAKPTPTLPTVAQLLHDDHSADLLDEVMPDLLESFRLGDLHPESARLQQRAADTIRRAYNADADYTHDETEAILYTIAAPAQWIHWRTALAEGDSRG